MRLSKRVSKIAPSATLKITAEAKRLKSQGVDVVSFGAGEPDFDTPDFIKQSAIDAIKSGFTKYTPSSGIPELKKVICEKLSKDNALSYTPEQIVVSCGAKHCLYNIFQAILNPEDQVVIPVPYWVSYPEMVKLAGGQPVFLKTLQSNNFKPDKKQILSSITRKTKAFILNSPSNPTGSIWHKQELETLAEIAASRGILVISDEIYEKLIYGDSAHISIASLGSEIYKNTIVVNGVSKTYSMTGWRIGYMAGPVEIIKAVSIIQDHSTSNPASISQKAALAALSDQKVFISNMVAEFKKRRDYMVPRLNSFKGLSCIMPEGAFYAFCDISKTGLDSNKFAERLLDEEKVALIPGEGFGSSAHVRLSFATSMENIIKGLDRIEKFANRL